MLRQAGFLIAQDASLGVGELAVGASADAEVVAELPVVQVVAAAPTRLGKGGNLVARKAMPGQQGKTGFFGVGHFVAVGLHRRVAVKGRVRLDGQLVPAQMGRLQGNGLLQIRQRLLPALPRQAVHQIQIEIIEAGLTRRLGGADRFVLAVNPAQCLQVRRVETLHANRQPIDAGSAVGVEPALLHRARIRLQRDFCIRSDLDALADFTEQDLIKIPGHQAWCAAANKHRFNTPPGHLMQVGADIFNQRRQIGLLGNRATLVGIEVAVRTFAHAPGHMNVQR